MPSFRQTNVAIASDPALRDTLIKAGDEVGQEASRIFEEGKTMAVQVANKVYNSASNALSLAAKYSPVTAGVNLGRALNAHLSQYEHSETSSPTPPSTSSNMQSVLDKVHNLRGTGIDSLTAKTNVRGLNSEDLSKTALSPSLKRGNSLNAASAAPNAASFDK